MVQVRGRPAPSEWEVIKPEFEDMYLRQNLTLNTIHQHFVKQGFSATVRQYKTKVKAWELDKKKIKGPVWHAMHVVMLERKQSGLESVFIVPIRGNDVDVVRPDRIWKQINRDRSAHDSNNIQYAHAILREHGVQVLDQEDITQRYTFQHQHPSQWQCPPPLCHSAPYSRPHPTETDSNSGSSTNSHSPSATRSLPTTPMTNLFVNNPNREVRGETSVTSPGATSIRPASASQLNSTSSGPHIGHYVDGTFVRPTLAPTSFMNDADTANVIDSLFFEPSCDVPSYEISQHDPGNASYQRNARPPEEARRIAVRWAKPYIRGFLSNYNKKPISTTHKQQDREAAKSAFELMLKESNRYLFPYCNWMLTVLASHNQTILLTEFLTDCCEVIDKGTTDYALTYGSPLHLTLALYTCDQREIDKHRLGFVSSTKIIRMLWGVDSPNYLVNQYYLAWLMLEQKQHSQAMQILEYCLPLAERSMGRQHVATLNCMTILARALAETSQVERAITILQDVAARLEGCANVLRAYRSRSAQRLADLLIEVQQPALAEATLRAVLEDRILCFGLDSDSTWSTINLLKTLLETQGREGEAYELEQQNRLRLTQEREARQSE